ncbi:MAG: hypothetical protein WCS85_03015 [Candidatus Peribacteraceae bacterium]
MPTKDVFEPLTIADPGSPLLQAQCGELATGGITHYEDVGACLSKGNGRGELKKAETVLQTLSEVCAKLQIPSEAISEQIRSVRQPYSMAFQALLRAHPQLTAPQKTEAQRYATIHARCHALACAIQECLASGNGDAAEKRGDQEPQRKPSAAKPRRSTVIPSEQTPAKAGFDLASLGITVDPLQKRTSVRRKPSSAGNPFTAFAWVCRHPIQAVKSMFGGSGKKEKRH